MTTEEYLRRKYGPAALGDAREEDVVEGLAPEDLEAFERRPVASEEPPLLDAEPQRDPVSEGRDMDAAETQRVGLTNASKKFVEAFSDDAYHPNYVTAAGGNEKRAKDHQRETHDYLLQKHRADTNRINAEAASKNASRPRVPPSPKADKPADPLDIEHKRLTNEKLKKDLAAKPVIKPARVGKNPNEGLPEGYESSPTNPASTDNKVKFTALVKSQARMRGLTDKMRAAMAQVGRLSGPMPGTTKTTLSGLAKMIQIEAKNVAELGALSGPDMGLVEAIIADPTQISNLATDIPVQLDALDGWADNSVDAGLKAYGVRKAGGGGAQTNDEDAKAIAWAKANPNDPDAKEILRLHGVR